MLRYWESGSPRWPRQNSSGQRIYRRRDIETVLRIKQLLYDEGFTIAGAKKRLESDCRAGWTAAAHARRHACGSGGTTGGGDGAAGRDALKEVRGDCAKY